MKSARRALTFFQDGIGLFLSRNAFQHAGALAFYSLFSLAPLLIIVVTIMGTVFGEEAARGEISARIDDLIGSQAAGTVEATLRRSRIAEAGLLPTILGIVALLFGATTVFAQMQASLNQLWDVVGKPSRSGPLKFLATRLTSLALVIAIGILLLASFVISTTLAALMQFAEELVRVPPALVEAVDAAVSLLTTTLLFAAVFKVLPDVRLRWRDMWQGAFTTALLFVLGKSLISLYLTRAAPASAYGAAGSLVMILLWIYYSSLILFFGAALTRAAIWQRGESIVPKSTAVRVRVGILEAPSDAVVPSSEKAGGEPAG